MTQDTGREYGWEDTIEEDSEFILLKPGDYDFTVEDFERGRHEGSEKLPPCNTANVRLKIESEQGTVTVFHRLNLHSKMEGMLSAFFAGIGLKKKGEKLQMNWNAVPGSTGRAKIGTRTYNGNEYNEVKKFYPKDESYQKKGTGMTPEEVAQEELWK